MRVALVYDRVNKWGGAERVLMELAKLFPKAPLYTSVYNRETARWADIFDVRTSFVQSIPYASSNHEMFPWLMPIAFESFNFDQYDLVISVTSAEAKGIITKPDTKHVCYCLTPTRYLWSHYDEYFSSNVFRLLTKPIVSHMRRWDVVASHRPDHMIAISSTVASRIEKYYKRKADIIFPPISVVRREAMNIRQKAFSNIDKPFFLVVSRLVAYKKVDLVIKAFNGLDKNLIIIGLGTEEKRLKQLAGSNIYFKSDLTESELAWYYHNGEALIMPQEEDFGLVSVEAQSHGMPVIAFNKGGALDTVQDGITGILFANQTVEVLQNMIQSYNKSRFNRERLVQNAKEFDATIFRKKFKAYIDSLSIKVP